jgi:hypothetical protein
VRKAKETYSLAWRELLTQQEKAGLILREIESYKVSYDAFTERFGFDIFEVVETQAPAVRESFEQYIRNHGFCRAWETYCLDARTRYRASGDSHLSDQWLGEINKPNGVSAALEHARRTHQQTVASAIAAYQAEIDQASSVRKSVVDPLIRRVAELEGEILRKEAAHQQALRGFDATEAELTRQQNAALESARHAAFANSVQIRAEIGRIEGKMRAQQARIEAHRSRIAVLQHPVHGGPIHHAPGYVAVGRGIVKIGKRVDIHSAAYQTFSVGDLNAEAIRLGQRIDVHTKTLAARRAALQTAEVAAQAAYALACTGINARYAPLRQQNAAARSQAQTTYSTDMGYLRGQLGSAQETLRQKTADEDAKYVRQEATSRAAMDAKKGEAARALAIAKGAIDAEFRKWWSAHSPGTIVGGSVNPPLYMAPPPVVLPPPSYNPFQPIAIPPGQ